MLRSLEVILEALPNLLWGALITLGLTAVSAVLSMLLGALIGVMRLSLAKLPSLFARTYIEFFRGTPLLVQIFWIYFGFPAVAKGIGLSLKFSPLTAAVLALSLNTGAYIAEVVRGSIQSIELGQREASESLGLGTLETMLYVIFPQAFRRMLPPLGNEFTGLIKNTSLVAVIGFEELFRKGQLVVAQNYRAFEIYTAIAIVYLILNVAASYGFSVLEWWMNPVERAKRRAAKPVASLSAE